MKVKVCGIQKVEHALASERYGADFIGFVFAPSSRRISPLDAKKIVNQLGENIKTVGVFVNESVETMEYIADLVGLDYIQLHGEEPAHVAKKLSQPVIKSFSFNKVEVNTILKFPCDYILIDSPGEKYAGGSGKTFDWKKLQYHPSLQKKLILAGGLNVNNVTEAMRTVQPIGVDVSSGVETSKVKDIKKIKMFIDTAKVARKVEL